MKFSIALVFVALSLGVSALPAPVNNEGRDSGGGPQGAPTWRRNEEISQ
jgi:hypothetical protein